MAFLPESYNNFISLTKLPMINGRITMGWLSPFPAPARADPEGKTITDPDQEKLREQKLIRIEDQRIYLDNPERYSDNVRGIKDFESKKEDENRGIKDPEGKKRTMIEA